MLPLEQLEISSTGRLGLQRAAQEHGVLRTSSLPSPPQLGGHRAALWGRAVGTARRAGWQVLPAVASVSFGAGEVAARSPCHLPSSASSSWALLRAPHHQRRPRVFWKSHFLSFPLSEGTACKSCHKRMFGMPEMRSQKGGNVRMLRQPPFIPLCLCTAT